MSEKASAAGIIELPEVPHSGEAMAIRSAAEQTRRACENCDHAAFEAKRAMGQCRINPPMAALVPVRAELGPGGIQAVSDWPPVKREQWCSQFKPKPGAIQ